MKRVFVLALGFGISCGGAGFTVSSTIAVPTPVSDVFACLRQQIQAVGYRQRSLDVDEHRLSAQRYDDSVHRPDVTFRRMVDVLEFEVLTDPAGGTTIKSASKTFAEYMSQRGQTLTQEPASDSVRAAGQAVLQACGH